MKISVNILIQFRFYCLLYTRYHYSASLPFFNGDSTSVPQVSVHEDKTLHLASTKTSSILVSI